jgi:hypothetical protein
MSAVVLWRRKKYHLCPAAKYQIGNVQVLLTGPFEVDLKMAQCSVFREGY